MPIFKYNARDAGGASVRGELEAANRKLALQKLGARKLKPVSVAEASTGAKGGHGSSFKLKSFLTQKVSLKSKVTLNRKLALPFLSALKELLACGIQAGDGLQLMSQRLNDPSQKHLASKLWEDVRQGYSLSEAFHNNSSVFDESMVSLVEAGEATGSLTNVLSRLVSNMEASKQIKSKLVSALAYPIFLIFIAFCLVLMFLFFLMPRIQNLLDSLGGDLPVSTQILIGAAEWSIAYGWIVVLGLVIGISLLISWRKTPKGRSSFDAFTLRIPFLGNFLRDLQILRLTQVLSLLLENGITMVQSLTMVERSMTNFAMRDSMNEVKNKVTEGASLSGSFKATGYFDGMTLDIFTVGENTGNVVPGLKQMVAQYGNRIDAAIKAFLGVISVVVLIMVFLFVGLVAIGVLSAVFQMSSSLSG